MKCLYCQREISRGQKFKVIVRGAGRRAIHVNCYEQRRRNMGAEKSEKYGVISSSIKKFHDGEPVFLIRATDPFASHAIIDYARRCQKAGASDEHVDAAFDHAMRVSEWQRDNVELVKSLPD